MKGHRNPLDGLWDMPIVTEIKQHNYKIPQIHPSIYTTFHKKSMIKPTMTRKVKKKHPPKESYSPYTLQNEQDLDHPPTDQAINVIIRRK